MYYTFGQVIELMINRFRKAPENPEKHFDSGAGCGCRRRQLIAVL